MCPVASLTKKQKAAADWWNQWYQQQGQGRREPWVHQGRGHNSADLVQTESKDQDKAGGGGEVGSPSALNPIKAYQDKIKHLEATPGGVGPHEQASIDKLKEELNAEKLKAEQAKPASASLQKLESQVKSYEQKLQTNLKQIEQKQAEYAQLEAEITTMQEQGKQLQQDYENAKAQLDEHTINIKPKHDDASGMDVCNGELDLILQKLPGHIGEEVFAEISARITSAAEYRRQTKAQQRNEQEALQQQQSAGAATVPAGSAAEPPARRNRDGADGEPDAARAKRRSRSRSASRERRHKVAHKKYRQELKAWNDNKPKEGAEQAQLEKWLEDQPDLPEDIEEELL